jgi:hypothetical protein
MKAEDGKRQPPVSIPLPFEQAVEGLAKVNPKAPIEATKAQKTAKKNRPKK